MKVLFGLGWIFSPLRYRRARRLAAGGAFAMGVFSFITLDLAPRDGHLLLAFREDSGPVLARLEFSNITEHAVTGLNAQFAFYDHNGVLLKADSFSPEGMTVEAGIAKTAQLGAEHFDPAKTAFLYFCGTFDGSYMIDQLREVWLLSRRTIPGNSSFGESHYTRDRYWVQTPDCTRPDSLQDFAAQTGFELEKIIAKYRDAGMIPAPQG